MELSYWEYKSWLSQVDFTIVGSGIVGLNTAIFLKERFPNAKVLILEKGVLPQGASTKNAGFACFGSISEIISDLKTHSQQEVFELVKQRFEGIQLLRELVGDKTLNLQIQGGHELFLNTQQELFEQCLEQMAEVNRFLSPIFGKAPFSKTSNQFGFQNIKEDYITHKFEGQLDTGNMMLALLKKATSLGVMVLNSIEVLEFADEKSKVAIHTNNFEFHTKNLFLTTNGFAKQFLNEDVKPSRAQVLVTKPIKDLHIKGTFHFDEGYYYFRNIDNRILLGGGRNLDFKTEETSEFGQTELVQQELERLLREVILPHTPFEVDRRWSGIMGVGQLKKPIVKQLSNQVFCGVRLGGMGVAIGSLVGRQLANLP